MAKLEPGPTAPADPLDRAARGTALNLVGAVMTTIAGFGSVLVVSRQLGAVATGLLFTGAGLFTLAANAAKLGTESSLTWYVSRARAGATPERIGLVVRSALRLVSAASVLGGVAFALLSGPLADLLTDDDGPTDDLRLMLVVFGLTLPTWSVAQACFGASRGYGTMRPAVLIGQILRPALMFGSLLAIVLLSDELWQASFSWTVGSTVAMGLALLWVHHRMGRSAPDGADDRRLFWSFTRPRAVSDLVHAALERLDVVLVSALAGAAAAGEYAAANRLVLAGTLVMMAMAQAVAPHVSAQLTRGEMAAAQQLIRTLTGWNVAVLWPFLAVISLGAPGVVRIFGTEFAGATSSVVVLAASLAIVSALGPGDTVLLMTGDSKGSLVNHIAALTVMVAVAAVLIPQLGATGAAWAWGASRLTLRLLSVWRIERNTGVKCVGVMTVLAAALVVVAFVPAAVFANAVLDDSYAVLGVITVVGGGLYLVLVWVFRARLEVTGLIGALTRRSSAPAS